jgi:hypothetical protein
MSAKRMFVLGLVCAGAYGCGADGADAGGDADEPVESGEQGLKAGHSTHARTPIGLSLFFSNGQAAPLEQVGSAPRFLQEIDIVESVTSTDDRGIAPLIESGTASGLDWRGVEQVEEVWVPSLTGTFTRERYFRNARWMEVPSRFTVVALDGRGRRIGAPLVAHAGSDDRWRPGDDGFVRRFVARQLAVGCPSVGNCEGAVFIAEALIQFRDALHPLRDDRVIPRSAAALELSFSELRGHSYQAALNREPGGGQPFGHGFAVSLEPTGAPANGAFYVPGESVSFRVTFRDGDGNRLHPPGQLPTYADFVAGQVESGLRYLDLELLTRLYYALKHRESNLLAVLSGPVQSFKTPETVVDPNLFFGPQVPFATTAIDGFTAVGQTVPPASIIFGGLADPTLWSLPVSDVTTLTIPADAQSGTYIAAIKARRDFAGEALNRGDTVEIQVGQTEPTVFTPKTQCTSCHTGPRANFGTILHGLEDRRSCFGCHSSLGVEFDNALDIRIHTIHDRSDRFDADIRVCSNCHLTPPEGPQRGVLP